ncbi:hypothetical protein [Hansschlegelia beijingensis]|uniref:Uncharacterized protein n=1 Tax=Hansschlegelia beijingensis TaxID=1133344 RepID=A0A7W6CYH1_9HYPH|nr:hypothetical protein [Hansschlegelia beijingensis]MBB3973371.1 hypothetical protein [Hansschlegelia beijingensis]
MNQAEAESLYKLLRDGLPLRARSDEDVIGFPSAIEDEIAAGKQVRVNLTVASEQRTEDPLAGSRTTASRSRAEFVQQRDFTSKEKVAITLDCIELARIAPARMADQILSLVRELSPNKNLTLCFAHDQADAPVRTITADDVAAALPATQKLAAVLDEIKAELGPETAAVTDLL